VSGEGRYAEAGTDLKTGAAGKSHDPVSGEVRVLLRGARGPLVARKIHPGAIAHSKIDDPLPDGVDHTSAVLVRRYLRERRCCTVTRAKAGLPIGGVDTGDDDADTDLARPRFDHIAIHEPEN
jgi:hypothetical protein